MGDYRNQFNNKLTEFSLSLARAGNASSPSRDRQGAVALRVQSVDRCRAPGA
jgi:hypothetical protein